MAARYRLLALALAAAAAAGCTAGPEASLPSGDQPPVEARTAVDRARATTGDVITYRVTVEHDEGLEVEIPEPGAEIAGFRIFDLGSEPPVRRRGRVRRERWYKLRADLVGSYVLPPVTVSYRPAAAAEAGDAGWQEVTTSALFVEVESVLPADGEVADIRGLKPLERPPTAVPWAWLAAAAALLAAAAGLFVYYRRRPRRQAPPQPPHELAFRALAELREMELDDPAAVRRFYFRLSEVVRGYLEGRWGLNATDLTSEEILAGLDRLHDLPPAERPRLRGFLLDTDRVKFADHRPAANEIGDAYERALAFVEATRPQELREEAA